MPGHVSPGESGHVGRSAAAGFKAPGKSRARLSYYKPIQTSTYVRRGRAHLDAVEPIAAPLVLSLAPRLEPVPNLRIRFVTPTEWKGADHSFGQLLRRARDRVSTLRALYGDGPLDLDFAAMGAAADAVCTTGSDLRHIDVDRRSTRTGQVHPLGGFAGTVDYAGDLAPFVPLLEAGTWTGIGRHTVWGQGQIEILVATTVKNRSTVPGGCAEMGLPRRPLRNPMPLAESD